MINMGNYGDVSYSIIHKSGFLYIFKHF